MIFLALVFLVCDSLEGPSRDEVDAVIRSAVEEAKSKTASPVVGHFEMLTPCLHSSVELFVSQKRGVLVRTSATFESFSPVMLYSAERDRLFISDEKELRVDIIDRSMIVATCRSYVFLVPEGNMHGFCIDAKTDVDRCRNLYLSRVLSNPSHADGGAFELSVPVDFEIFKDLPPLSASILHLDREAESDRVLVKLDRGTRSKLRIGMRLNFRNEIPFEIIEAEHEYSVARSMYPLSRPFYRSNELKIGSTLESVIKLVR